MKLIILLVALLAVTANGFQLQNKKIQHSQSGCYIYNMRDTSNAGFFLYGDGTTYPTCPSSHTGSVAVNEGLFCAANLQQVQQLVEAVPNQWDIVSNPAPSTGAAINRYVDNSLGNTQALFTFKNIDTLNSQLWCSSTVNQDSWQPADNVPCYIYPTTKFSYCLYTNYECSIDGICYQDTLDSEIHFMIMTPFFEGVYQNSDLYMSFIA
jgi:hypothetical protein